jgi:PAS domain-containing protein
MSEVIIKQMRSEEVLIESERFAYKVLNASLNGIYIHDVKLGQNVFINSQYPVLRCTNDGALLYANASARDWLATFGW